MAKRKRDKVEEESSEDEDVEESGTNGVHESDISDSDNENNHSIKNSDHGEIGILEEITLQNFMCHKHLQLKLGPNINFIVGQNGSGKSAVLVALTVGLGAKAGFTNRGQKLTDLIRKGASYCTISIRLRNQGTEAYKPKEYGPAIIVERRLTKEGGSSIKLRDHTGKKTVATTMSELQLILEQFNIQVNNPCAILMQDTSRSFLTSASAKDKYKFFLKATQLEQMEKDYKFMNSHLETMKTTMAKKERLLPDMEKDMQEYEREYNELHTLRDLESKMEVLKKMMAWALVKEAEEEVENAKEAQQKVFNEKEKLAKEKAALEVRQERNKADVENRGALVAEFNRKLSTLQEEKNTLEKELASSRKEISTMQMKGKDLKKRLDNVEKRRKNVEKHIADTRKQNAKDKRDEVAHREEKLRRIQQKRDEEMNDHNQKKQQRAEYEQQLAKLSEEAEQLRRDEDVLKKEKERLGVSIRNLESQKNNKVGLFGALIPSLLEQIKKNERNFKKTPMGPIGMLMRVKDEKWAGAIEVCTRKVLQAWIVDNSQDYALLRKLAQGVGLPGVTGLVTPIIDRVYRIPQDSLPDRRFTTMLDLIEADHPMVINHLIDQAHVESQILIPTRNEATEIMFTGRPPANVGACWLPDGATLNIRNGSENYIPHTVQRKFLSVDVNEQIKTLQERNRQLQYDLVQAGEATRQAEQERNRVRRELDTLKRNLNAQQVSLNQLEKDIQEMQNFHEEPPPDISELEESLNALESEKQQLNQELHKLEADIATAVEKSRPQEENVAAKTAELDKMTTEHERLNEGASKTLTVLQQAATKIAQIGNSIIECDIKIHRLTETVKEKETELAEITAKARQICEPVPVTKTCAIIDKETQALEKRIDQERNGMKKSVAEITNQYRDAKKRYREVKHILDKLQKLRERLQGNLIERHKRWRKFRSSIAKRTTLLFNSNLSQKGFAGNLTFDHDKETLEITVQLENAKQTKNLEVRDTKALSGGERSYSTVSLLLALWEAMESPFRAMDEFDVFMDSVNRQISIQMLIDAARGASSRQFIFITPHDYSKIGGGPDIKIHRMQPPQRGQSTLDFSQGMSNESESV